MKGYKWIFCSIYSYSFFDTSLSSEGNAQKSQRLSHWSPITPSLRPLTTVLSTISLSSYNSFTKGDPFSSLYIDDIGMEMHFLLFLFISFIYYFYLFLLLVAVDKKVSSPTILVEVLLADLIIKLTQDSLTGKTNLIMYMQEFYRNMRPKGESEN